MSAGGLLEVGIELLDEDGFRLRVIHREIRQHDWLSRRRRFLSLRHRPPSNEGGW